MYKLSDTVERKFVETRDLDDYEIWTPQGWKSVKNVSQTIEYEVWRLTLENGYQIECADTHIVMTPEGEERFVCELLPGDLIGTDIGPSAVSSVENLGYSETMYDLEVDSEEHEFYSNGIASHNSISVAAILLWYVIFNETFEIAIMAQKGSQAAEILKRIKTMYENLPWWLQPGVSTWNKGNIILGNGSEIFTGAGELRGRSVNILYWDEYAFVENAYEMYTGNYPIVTSGQNSKLFITSTPNGMNHFYKLWKDSETGKNNYVRDEAFWYEHPKRDQAWKEAQLRNMSERQFDQEFNTQFLGSSDTLISGDALAALTYVDPIGYFGDNKDYRIYEYPVSGNSYVVTVDVSEGIGKDYSVISVIDCTKTPFVQVAMIRDNYIDPLYLATMVSKIGTMYNEALVVIETNSIGKQTSDALWIDLEYENMLMSRSAGKKSDDIKGSGKSQDYGIRTTKRTKSLGCTALKSLIESNNLIIKDFDTVSELSSFSKKGTSFAAEGDKTDDIVMTLVSFAWLSQQPYFADMVDLNVRKLIVDNIQNQEDFNSAFGFFNDGTTEEVDNSWLFPSVRPGEYKPQAL